MSWMDILKYSGIGKKVISELKSNIGKYGIDDYDLRYVPDTYTPLGKDFYAVLDEILAEIQKNYLDEKEWRGSSEKTVGKVKGNANMNDNIMRIQLAPVDSKRDKHDRYGDFYFYLNKRRQWPPDAETRGDSLSAEDYYNLIAIILQVER